MQEFSSVTASSYDADSLTPLLNEKSADGWAVVSIVSAGTNIVAYLSRDTDDLTEVLLEEAIVEEAIAEELLVEAVVVEAAAEELFVEAAVEEAAAEELFVEAAVEEAAAEEVLAEAVADTAVDEPAGWANAPEETAPADDSIASLAAQVGAEEATPEAAVVEPAAVADAAVPAGWYADPSGRYELRYWDGAAWTEHVSRAGQQFTDPPVA